MSEPISGRESTSTSPSFAPETETEEYRQALYLASVEDNVWLRQKPTATQAKFLHLTVREALYGGAAGGGKSSALLMSALQFVDVPGYAAILLRCSYSDLSLPGALMDRAAGWLGGTRADGRTRKKVGVSPAAPP